MPGALSIGFDPATRWLAAPAGILLHPRHGALLVSPKDPQLGLRMDGLADCVSLLIQSLIASMTALRGLLSEAANYGGDRQAAERELEASEGRRGTAEAALRERDWGHELQGREKPELETELLEEQNGLFLRSDQ